MMVKKLSVFLCCICFVFISYGQTLELVDLVKLGFGHLSELHVNQKGERYFIVNRASDSLIINGKHFDIPPRDTAPGSHYRFGRSYIAGVSSDNMDPFIHRPGGEVLRLTDTSLLVFTTIYEDSLLTAQETYINHADGRGTNLLLIEYDFDGSFLQSKQWKSTYDLQYVLQDAVFYQDRLFIVGKFTAGRPNQFLELDENTLSITSNGDCFFGVINDDLEMEELFSIYGDLNDYIFRITVNHEGEILVTGSSTSNIVNNSICPLDTLVNPSLNPWTTTFMHYHQFSSDYTCLESGRADFDYNGGVIGRVIPIEQGGYAIFGDYSANYIQYDDVRLENQDFTSSYIFTFSADMEAQAGLQVNGSQGTSHLTGMTTDKHGHIWICGISAVDTIILDDFILTRGPATSTFWGFLAKLDTDLNVLKVKNMGDEECREIIRGDDNELYLRTQIQEGHERLYRLVDSVSSVVDNEGQQNNWLQVFPNPASDRLFFQVDNERSAEVQEIQIYHVDGKQVYLSKKVDQQNGIELNLPNGLYFVNFILSDGMVCVKKIVIQR